jgi:hypothetical protein
LQLGFSVRKDSTVCPGYKHRVGDQQRADSSKVGIGKCTIERSSPRTNGKLRRVHDYVPVEFIWALAPERVASFGQ